MKRRWSLVVALIAGGLAGALAAGHPEPAAAVTYAVTKTEDTADGACDADCSLREAVIAANAAPGMDTITIPVGTYQLTNGAYDSDNTAAARDSTSPTM